MQYDSTAKNTGQWNTGRRPASDRLTLIVLNEAGSGKVFLKIVMANEYRLPVSNNTAQQ